MQDLPQLWLPILATAVFVFIASSFIHMLFKWHNSDYQGLSNEDDARRILRDGQLPPGQYVIPYCKDMKDMQGEAMQQKYRDGPQGFLIVRPNGPISMAKPLTLWFLLNLAIATMAACLAVQSFSLQGDNHYAAHLVGMTSFMAYGAGSVSFGIWWGKPWISVAKDLLDALIYSTISAMTFMWLWP